MIKPIRVLILLILFFGGGNIFGTSYYVDSDGGSDANSGKTSSSAWNSISRVNSYNFNSGDTVCFKADTRLMLSKSLSSKKNIIFTSYGTGAKPVLDGGYSYICADFEDASNVKFINLKFVNGYPNNIALWKCTNILIESCNVDSSRGASIYNCNIYSGQGSYLSVRNSTINYGDQSSGNGNLGIYIDGTDNSLLEYDTILNNFSNIRIGFGNPESGNSDWTDNLIIRYCVVKYGVYDNIDDDGSKNAQIYYNLFETNTSSGYHDNVYIFSDGSGNYPQYSANGACYYNNTFIAHSGGGSSIEIQSGAEATNITLQNNIFYNSSRTGWMFYSDNTYGALNFNNNIYYVTGGIYDHYWHIYGNTVHNFESWQSLGFDTTSYCINPLFINYDAGDFSLQSGSPAINSGTYVGLTSDINGNPVPPNSPDIGAYQHYITQNTLVNIKVLLEGMFNDGKMSTFYNSNKMISLSQPYNSSPWNYTGSESVAKIPANVVDWILVEVRTSNGNYSIVTSRAGFLKSDGIIVDLDGVSPLNFKNISSGYYYIVIKYVNAIETWSKNGGELFANTTVNFDFTSAQSQAFGNNLVLVDSKWCIYSGDINQNGSVDKDDYNTIDDDNYNFNYHVAKDLNGDGMIDLSDLIIADCNHNNNICTISPLTIIQ
ncbi:MAG: choice-of-anchor Q domain-containing protein [Ignavibacteriaceae bacterium]|nr:choice-of-anchor Q domain-containing protein [Ignavibacteriaceae bacterium]